jgi:ketosteroid isomerase-like protein
MFRDRIEAYFSACSEGDAAAIASHFTDDAVVYDLNHAPVVGAASIGSCRRGRD